MTSDLCYQICADWFGVEPLCVCSHHERNKSTRSSGRMWGHVCSKQVLVVVNLYDYMIGLGLTTKTQEKS